MADQVFPKGKTRRRSVGTTVFRRPRQRGQQRPVGLDAEKEADKQTKEAGEEDFAAALEYRDEGD